MKRTRIEKADTLWSVTWLALLVVLFCSGGLVLAQDEGEAEAAAESTESSTDESAEARARRAERYEERKAEAMARRQSSQNIKDAISKLKAEAKELDQLKEPNPKPVFKRPHEAIKRLGPDEAVELLGHMASSHTSNKYLDTYINWHLMPIIKQGRQSDREEMGKQLVKLIESMPGPIEVQGKQDHHYEPPDVYAEYRKLVNSLRRVKGYPPYQVLVGPPESLSLMNSAERAGANQVWARAQELRKQIELVVDKEARAFNQRIRDMNLALREYRGELIYEILRTGDPKMLDMVITAMDKQAKAKTGIQFDLMNYMYLAAFDGSFNLYAEDILRKSGADLERIARSHEEWVEYMGVKRNFADYAFHMVHMLKEGNAFIAPRELSEEEEEEFRRQRRRIRF